MTRFMRYDIFLVVLFIISSAMSSADAQNVNPFNSIRPYVREFRFTATGQDSIFYVDSTIVAIDSIVIRHNDTSAPCGDFLFKPQTGEVILAHPPEKGAVVKISGFISPFPAGITYFNREVILLKDDVPDSQSQSKKLPIPVSPQQGEESALFKSGSLTRAFSFGTNRGLELQSGLSMQIRGKLGKEYEIQAVLTDQNTPLQPEGNTRTLNEIDNIYIDIAGPGLSSRFGDLYLEKSGLQFGNFYRKLEGVTANTRIGKNDVSSSFATTEGQFHSLKIQGIEGNQGPYMLTGKNGERDIIILAGTEKVYIDGNPMVRGEDYDYVIDYASGLITFTRNRLITGYSRIVVDFQYSDGNYKKSFYNMNLENIAQSSGLSYSFSLVRESDNNKKPQTGAFSGDDISHISVAGDNPLLAYKSGVQYVGSGKGSYQKVVEDNHEYYVYADSADYKVMFSDVGEGSGNYSLQRIGVYTYVGENNGRYMPVVLLPLPLSHYLTNISLGYTDDDRRVSFNSEYAFSMLDKNTLSERDDNDNGGGAFAMEFAVEPSELSLGGLNFGTASIKTKLRRTGINFKPVDRTVEVEFDRKWDLDRQSVSGESIFEAEGEYSPGSFLSVKPSLGFFKMGGGFQSSRQAAHVLIRQKSPSTRGIDYFIENISSTKISGYSGQQNWLRQKGTASYQIMGITPSLFYESEYKKDSQAMPDGFSFKDGAAKLQYNYRNNFMTYGMYQVRKDKNFRNGVLEPVSRSENRIFHIEIKQGKRLFSRIHVVNRNREYHTQDKNVQTDLADIKVQSSELQGGLNTRFDLQVSTEKIPEKDLVYIRVEEGRGNYSFDERYGEYFPDSNGDYELRTFTTDKLHGIRRKKIGLTFDFDPSRFLESRVIGASNLLRFIRSSSIFRYEDNSGEGNITSGSNLKNDNTLFKLMSINQDIYVFEKNEIFNLRLRQNYRLIKNNQYIARREDQESFLCSLRLRSRINPITSIESNIGYERTMKNIETASILKHNITTLKSDLNVTVNPDMNWRLFVKVIGARQRGTINVHYYALNPGFERAFLGSGRLSGDVRWFEVNSNQGKYIPYDPAIAGGNQPGSNVSWSLSFDYRSTQNFITSFRYQGSRKTRYDKILHNLRTELQILF